jgi:hypothetical protein
MRAGFYGNNVSGAVFFKFQINPLGGRFVAAINILIDIHCQPFQETAEQGFLLRG